ncbi:MAG: gliding motility protein GldN, partial [Flavobacteriales bacterium]|nr:gliding motility protein GldN [Flavobacteriales bacterium]
KVTLYDGLDDEFKVPVDLEGIPALSSQTDSIYVYNPVTEMDELTVITNEFNPETVNKFRLKEIWYFNEETSTMECRILGIAPVMEKYGEFGNYQGDVVIFWAYFPDLRETLVQTEAYNPFPNGIKLTFDDLFAMRLFSSYIIKEDNVDDLRIQDYTTGINALYESERIKEELFNFEHDLWSY